MSLRNWGSAFSTCNPAESEEIDVITKLLLISRVCVLPMTWTSALIGFLLAYIDGYFNVIRTILVFIGLTLAHMANNMVNDYYDYKHGVDSIDYVRNQYSVHPILSGLISEGKLLALALVLNLVDLAIMLYLTLSVGWLVLVFAVLGFFFSFFYVADPINLKRIALGEISVFMVWGPLMIGGTYYVISGTIGLRIILLSIPYAFLVMNVLMGKHIDKIGQDVSKNIKTLPVILGEEKSKKLVKAMTWFSLIVIVVLVYIGYLTAWALITLLAIPRIRTFSTVLNMEKPSEPPFFEKIGFLTRFIGTRKILESISFNKGISNWPIWPLWYVAWAFWVNRSVGTLFIFSLVLQILYPIDLNYISLVIQGFF